MIYTDLPIYELYLFHLTQLFYNLHKSLLVSPYIIFSDIFGIKTIWYMQFQCVCCILLIIHLDTSYAFDMACETNIIYSIEFLILW